MKIPFSVLPSSALKVLSHQFFAISDSMKKLFPFLEMDLKQGGSDFNPREYISACLVSNILSFIILFLLSSFVFYNLEVKRFLLGSFVISFALAVFVFADQMFYPKLLASRRVRELERNLLLALRNVQIDLNSGVSLFQSLVNVSRQNYGEVSNEFGRVVKDINSGISAANALELSIKNNPSLHYRRAVWQIVNGIKSGSDTGKVLNEVINSLSKEQIIEIENYGSRLSPLAMFYMIIAVIMPSLAMTMLIVLSSFVAANAFTVKVIFFGLYILVLFFQLMFLGMIKSRRPNLLGS